MLQDVYSFERNRQVYKCICSFWHIEHIAYKKMWSVWKWLFKFFPLPYILHYGGDIFNDAKINQNFYDIAMAFIITLVILGANMGFEKYIYWQ